MKLKQVFTLFSINCAHAAAMFCFALATNAWVAKATFAAPLNVEAEEQADAAANEEATATDSSGADGAAQPAAAKTLLPDAGGNLLIAPTRAIFSGRNRSTEIVLKNSGGTTTTYRMELIDLDVKENGDYAPTDHYAKSAVEMIRFAPRQVTLAPGETQKVKLMVRKPANLATGEYRAHLKFQALPNANAGADVEAVQLNDKVSVKLIPIVGISIPVIVQQGDVTPNISLKASLGSEGVNLTINRSGEASAVGEVVIRDGSNILASTSASVWYPAKYKNMRISLPASAVKKALTAEFVRTENNEVKVLATTSITP